MRFKTIRLFLTPKMDIKNGFRTSSTLFNGIRKFFVPVGNWNRDGLYFKLPVGAHYANDLIQRKQCSNDGDAKIGVCQECGAIIKEKDIVVKTVDQCGIQKSKQMARHNLIEWMPMIECGNIIRTPLGILLVEERPRDRQSRHTAVVLRIDGVSPVISFEPKSKEYAHVHQKAHGVFSVQEKPVAVEKVLVLTEGDDVSIARTVKSPDSHELISMKWTGSDFDITKREQSDKPFAIMPMAYADNEHKADDNEVKDAIAQAELEREEDENAEQGSEEEVNEEVVEGSEPTQA